MAQVLLTGHPSLLDGIASCLQQWGTAVDSRPAESLPNALAERQRYDLLIVACPGQDCRALCRLMASLQGEAVPILLVGGKESDCHCRNVCRQSLPWPGVRWQLLRVALESCLGQTFPRQQEAAQLTALHQYVQFLNHELRTPLTAAQTALQALARELASAKDSPRGALLEIALRNVERLRRAVTWSEDYLATRTVCQRVHWRWISVQELISRLQPQEPASPGFRVECRPDLAPRSLITAPDLLQTVGQQVWRALRCHDPAKGIVLDVHLRDTVPEDLPAADIAMAAELVLCYRTVRGPCQPAPAAVVRTGLVANGEQPEHELVRLMGLTVSREILSQLHARVVIDKRQDADDPVTELVLPFLAVDHPSALADCIHQAGCR
jgi:hypothetical protein